MSENKSKINWFPGHMAKAKGKVAESLKLVDLTAEILDARIPIASQNADLKEICKLKPRIVVLNKTDLISEKDLKSWLDFYKKKNICCIPFSNKVKTSKKLFEQTVLSTMQEKIENWKSKGMLKRKLRIMIVGIPNVGKSSFINIFAKNSKAKVENRPGVTRINQWVSAGENLEFLDTPGILQPKISSKEAGYNLAITGSIKDSILDIEDLASFFIEKIKIKFSKNLIERYKLELEDLSQFSAEEILSFIAKKRGMLISGGEVDFLRVCKMIIEEFKSGKLGKIILEEPEILSLEEGKNGVAFV